MSTRSVIAMLETDGSVKSIYCHHDGYLSYNGNMLLKHYNTEEKVKALIAEGDTSGIDEKGSDAYAKNGEKLMFSYSAKDMKNFEKGLEKDGWDIEYVYLFKDGKWLYHNGYRTKPFEELTEEAINNPKKDDDE